MGLSVLWYLSGNSVLWRIKNSCRSWPGWLSWLKCHPVNWKMVGSIPGQGTCLGCRFGPSQGECKRQLIDVSLSHQCFSPSLSPSLPLSLKSISMSSGEDFLKKYSCPSFTKLVFIWPEVCGSRNNSKSTNLLPTPEPPLFISKGL